MYKGKAWAGGQRAGREDGTRERGGWKGKTKPWPRARSPCHRSASQAVSTGLLLSLGPPCHQTLIARLSQHREHRQRWQITGNTCQHNQLAWRQTAGAQIPPQTASLVKSFQGVFSKHELSTTALAAKNSPLETCSTLITELAKFESWPTWWHISKTSTNLIKKWEIRVLRAPAILMHLYYNVFPTSSMPDNRFSQNPAQGGRQVGSSRARSNAENSSNSSTNMSVVQCKTSPLQTKGSVHQKCQVSPSLPFQKLQLSTHSLQHITAISGKNQQTLLPQWFWILRSSSMMEREPLLSGVQLTSKLQFS